MPQANVDHNMSNTCSSALVPYSNQDIMFGDQNSFCFPAPVDPTTIWNDLSVPVDSLRAVQGEPYTSCNSFTMLDSQMSAESSMGFEDLDLGTTNSSLLPPQELLQGEPSGYPVSLCSSASLYLCSLPKSLRTELSAANDTPTPRQLAITSESSGIGKKLQRGRSKGRKTREPPKRSVEALAKKASIEGTAIWMLPSAAVYRWTEEAQKRRDGVSGAGGPCFWCWYWKKRVSYTSYTIKTSELIKSCI